MGFNVATTRARREAAVALLHTIELPESSRQQMTASGTLQPAADGLSAVSEKQTKHCLCRAMGSRPAGIAQRKPSELRMQISSNQ